VKLYSDTDGINHQRYVVAEVCSTCYKIAIDNGQTEQQIAAVHDGNGRDRFSFGIYAGHYCLEHWRKSGYKDEEAGAFDPAFAGERLEEEDP
jgi:hypothetical protein